MKNIFKILLEVILVITILILILIFLIFSAKSEIVPSIYATSESGKLALAITGGYKWNSFSESKVVDSISPNEYVYLNENTLLVNPGEKMTLRNSDNPLECYKFYQLEMKYYDEADKEYMVSVPENSKAYADMDYLELIAPENEGIYIYNFKLSYYNNGEVSYGLKVVVSAEPNYDIVELSNYRNTKLTDNSAISIILNILPYSKNRNGIIIKTGLGKNELVVNYEELVVNRDDLINNIIALFTLIPDLNVITYKSEIDVFYFSRQEIENKVGRNLEDYSNDIELWKKEILFREKINNEKSTRETIYKLIIEDVLSKNNKDEINCILIDTDSFKETKLLEISNVDAQEILEYASEFSEVVYDMGYKEYKGSMYDGIFISVVDIKDKLTAITENLSGDLYLSGEALSGNIDYDLYKDIYICTVIVSNNNRSVLYKYEINYNNDKWNIMEL